MGENSKIEWTDHTFNAWFGCTKVSAGCLNCYADRQSRRNPQMLGIWGDNGTRVTPTETYWEQPIQWDRAAARAGERHRVFVNSFSDFLEAWGDEVLSNNGTAHYIADDQSFALSSYESKGANTDGMHPTRLVDLRARLLNLIAKTPHLDWLFVTKRPENFVDVLHQIVTDTHDGADMMASYWLDGDAPHNVWFGTTVENQEAANTRLPALLRIPSACLFLSVEPLLSYVDFTAIKMPLRGESFTIQDVFYHKDPLNKGFISPAIDWVIVGGESGPGARPMDPEWVRAIRDHCIRQEVPFFFKQWGEWAPRDTPETQAAVNRNLQSHQFPQTTVNPLMTTMLDNDPTKVMVRVGKKAAGRMLDGRTWDEFPQPREVVA